MSGSPTVLVACEDPILLDEVIRHLEEIPHWRLPKSVRSIDQLLDSGSKPDCVLLSDGLAGQLAAHPRAGRLPCRVVIFGRQESTDALRAGLRLGARGFVLWPDERSQLRELVEIDAPAPAVSGLRQGALHAVWAPKGGAGASVVAAHLAGAVALLGGSPVLVDLDLDHADQTALLGAEPGTKTVGDLLRVADELSESVIQSVLWSHPLGFRAVLAPGKVGDNGAAQAPAVGRVLTAIRGFAQNVVADLPSGINSVSLATLNEASSVSVVLTPDLLGLRRARDLIRSVTADGLPTEKMNVILNQAGGSDITPKEVEAVLGIAAVTRVRADFQIYRAANRGELSPLGCKMLTPLAKRLSETGAPRPAATDRTAALPESPAAPPTGRETSTVSGTRTPAPPAVLPRKSRQSVPSPPISWPAEESRRVWPVKSRN